MSSPLSGAPLRARPCSSPLFHLPRAATRRTTRWPLATALTAVSAAVLTTLPALAIAQVTPPATPPSVDKPGDKRPDNPVGNPVDRPPAAVVVTGHPLGTTMTAPASVLAGDALVLRRAGTLGDTLDGLPGVAASSFGPQSSRPVIRGLDGDRIRVLDNGGAAVDASNLSFDHAVAVDPLVVERLEVLRGPAALLYGGNATGGVVNAIDNRIPRSPLGDAGGRVDLRAGGAAGERAAAALLEGGAGGLNWHADAARSLTSDLRTPDFTPRIDGQPGDPTRRIANSSGERSAGAVGASWADAQGFAGVALDGLRNHYGVAVDPGVRIRLQRDRLQAAGERRDTAAGTGGVVESVSWQASRTRYQHQEVESDGAVGTTFRSTGDEARLQATLAPRTLAGGTLRGVVGLQAERLDFSALGEEAFVPSTRTRSAALFTLQELALGAATLQAGVRLERVSVTSDGDAADASEARFGPAQRRSFQPRSLSLGVQAPLAWLGPGWRATATVGSTQRAPAYYELFANGLHVATGAFEQGDTAQRLERSRHLEAGLQWQQAGHSLRAALWTTRFANFIALDATGAVVPTTADDGSTVDVPVYRFAGVPARLQGGEVEWRRTSWTHPALAGWTLEQGAGLDWVRGDNRATGQPLPRIAPLRLHATLDARRGAWLAGLQLRHAARQDRVPANDSATPGWTTVDLWAGWRQRLDGVGAEALWTLKLSNLGDVLAFNAGALPTARWLAPAGGRALQAGVRVAF